MSLKKKTIHGLAWSFASQGGKQICQFVVTAILAHLLYPKDFGLIGMATVFTGFADVFNDLGISRALIHKQDTDEKHLSSAFWLNVLFGAFLTTTFILISPLIAGFYRKPEITGILSVLSFNFFMASFTIVQQTILTKEMNFKALFIRDISAIVISGAVGVFLATQGFGPLSLVYQTLTFTLVNGILLWALSPWRPRMLISLSSIKDIFFYSANVTGFNVVNYLARNMDYLLIGRFLGPNALGLYTLAYKLMLVPLQNVSLVVTKVMFPAFSKIQHDLEKIRGVYLKMMKYISFVTFPLMLGLFVVAPEFIIVIYGPKWEPVILLVRILCVCGMLQSLYTTTSSVILSQGRSELLFRLSVFNVLFVTMAIILGLKWGINGVAVSYALEQILWVVYVQGVTNRLIKLKPGVFTKPLAKNIFAASIMMVSLFVFRTFVSGITIINLTLYMIFSCVVYFGVFVKMEKINIKARLKQFKEYI